MGSILSELPSTPTACQRGLGDTPDTRTPFWAQVCRRWVALAWLALCCRVMATLMDKIVEMLPSIGMTTDQRTYEILLSIIFTMRKFSEVKALVAEMRRRACRGRSMRT